MREFCKAVQRGGGITFSGNVQKTTGCGTLCCDVSDKLVLKGWTKWSWKSFPALMIFISKKEILFPQTRYCEKKKKHLSNSTTKNTLIY